MEPGLPAYLPSPLPAEQPYWPGCCEATWQPSCAPPKNYKLMSPSLPLFPDKKGHTVTEPTDVARQRQLYVCNHDTQANFWTLMALNLHSISQTLEPHRSKVKRGPQG